jgi:hypothetical protein
MTTLYLQLPQKNVLYSIHTLCVGRHYNYDDDDGDDGDDDDKACSAY